MNDITLGLEIAATFLTALYLGKLILIAIAGESEGEACTDSGPLEKHSLVRQQIWPRSGLAV